MVLTVFCCEKTMATRCRILEESFTFLAIFRKVSVVRLSVWRMCALLKAENVPVALERNCLDGNLVLIQSLIFLNLFETSQFWGNKPVTWKNFLISWVLIRWCNEPHHGEFVQSQTLWFFFQTYTIYLFHPSSILCRHRIESEDYFSRRLSKFWRTFHRDGNFLP